VDRMVNADEGICKGYMWLNVNDFEVDGTNPPATTSVGTAGQATFDALNFDDTTTDVAFTSFAVPRDYYNGLKMRIHWNVNSTSTTTRVVWDAAINCVAVGAAIDAAGTAVTAVGTVGDATAYDLRVTELNLDVSGEVFSAGKLITIMLSRDHDHTAGDEAGVADDMAVDANFLGAEILWNRSA